MKALIARSCPTLCDPMDCSPPGSSVHGILQAGILESVAIPSSRGSSQFRDRTHVSYVAGRLLSEPPGSEDMYENLPPRRELRLVCGMYLSREVCFLTPYFLYGFNFFVMRMYLCINVIKEI